ncbi:hypothetical protein VNI00_016961 [Paramarasmius palmivorus]|uniref:Uncharacterized protein n=1 Tax=Paramarasmius palmivorus TaxID=297713 RepID=A0AAW0BB69_9AGAR
MLHLFALARPITSAISSNETTPFDPNTGECIDINGCRTSTDIIWSCISVIFICTWVAIHPNIPIVRKRQKQWHPAVVFYQNVELMIIAIFAPEFMILWAMRQREKAKEIREKFKQYGWGMTHGFFVIMGGFTLYDGDTFCGYLWDDSGGDRDEGLERWISQIGDQHEYVQKGPGQNPQPPPVQDANDTTKNTKVLPIQDKSPLINTPSDASCLLEFLLAKGYITITEDEIKDRSHADFVSKSIAVIQTTWFIFQVIARAVEGLAITEIEIITVGFALLNLGTYFLWWNKPLRVGYPVTNSQCNENSCFVGHFQVFPRPLFVSPDISDVSADIC